MARKRGVPGSGDRGPTPPRGKRKVGRAMSPPPRNLSTQRPQNEHVQSHHQIASAIHERAASFSQPPPPTGNIHQFDARPGPSSRQVNTQPLVQTHVQSQGVADQSLHPVTRTDTRFLHDGIFANPQKTMPSRTCPTRPVPLHPSPPDMTRHSTFQASPANLEQSPAVNANDNVARTQSNPPPERGFTSAGIGGPSHTIQLTHSQPMMSPYIGADKRVLGVSTDSPIMMQYSTVNGSLPPHGESQPNQNDLRYSPGGFRTEADPTGRILSRPSNDQNGADTDGCLNVDPVVHELRAIKQIMNSSLELAREQMTATMEQTVALKNLTETLTRMEGFIENLPSHSTLSQVVAVECKPVLEKKRIFDALRLTCVYPKCESQIAGRDCSVGAMWSKALTNRLPGLKRRSGSPLGVYVSDMARDPSADANAFYPIHEAVFRNVFTQVVRYVSQLIENTNLDLCHVDSFFEKHKSVIVGEISNAFRNSRNTKKSELVRNFKTCCPIECYKKFFENREAIQNGDYRRNEQSPIDKLEFVQALKKTFGLSSAARSGNALNNKIRISVHQLSFANISLIRSFSDLEASTVPSLFEIVPSGAIAAPTEESFREMIELMAVSMSNILDSYRGIRRTQHGWETTIFDVQNSFIGNEEEYASYKIKLGGRIL